MGNEGVLTSNIEVNS